MTFIKGCNYGDETLKIVHSGTISLIENPDGDNAKEIFAANKDLGWFFIPQVILRPHEDKAWLALRIYSYGSELNYKVSQTKVSFPKDGILERDYSIPAKLDWYPTGNGWLYQVVRLKAYNYSSLMSSGVDSARVEFEVIASVNERQVKRGKIFDLEVKKVHRSGW